MFKYVPEFTPQIHLNLTVCLARDREFNRMSDESNAVLLECGNDVRFSTAEDSPMKWDRSLPDQGCNYLDNFCFCISTCTFI